MRKVLTWVAECLFGILALIILVGLSPVLLVIGLVFGPIAFYKYVWMRLRRDPHVKLGFERGGNEAWAGSETKDDYLAIFGTASKSIAELAGAKQGKVVAEGFDVFDPKNTAKQADKDLDLSLRQTLRTEHAEMQLIFHLYASKNPETEKFAIWLEDEDDRCASPFPPISVEIITPSSVKHTFNLRYIEDAWTVISLLRGEAILTKHKQLWAHVPEYKIWLVLYDLNGATYGQRAQFGGKTGIARQYRHDTSR